MSALSTIFQSKLMREVLAASCYQEVKKSINTSVLQLEKNKVPDDKILVLIDNTLKALKTLNQDKLSYDQHANIISAIVHLKKIQLQMMNVIN